jgi:hypothetical protein
MAGPAFNSSQLIKNIRLDQLDIKKGEISGDLVSGGSITSFSSTGIDDQATTKTVTVQDGLLIVDNIQVKELKGETAVRGNLQVLGNIRASKIYVDEIVADRKYDKMYLEFEPIPGSDNPNGSGLIWKGADYTKLFVLKGNNQFFASESINLANDRNFQIDGVEVLSKNTLGTSIRKSNIRETGPLNHLTVVGDTSLSEFVKFSSDQQRIAINVEAPVGTVTIGDIMGDVILNIDVDNGRAKIGTFNNRPFDLTAGDRVLMTLDPKGIVSVGQEYNTQTETRVWGKMGVNVKNPEADLEVRDSIRFGNKLFMVYNSPPEKGNYKRGDIVWNEVPSPGSSVGWVCVVAGAPGIWKTFGAISE